MEEPETIEIEGNKYEVVDYDHAGTPIIKGLATSVHHTDDDGNPLFDDDGNPTVSVHISASPIAEPIAESATESITEEGVQ